MQMQSGSSPLVVDLWFGDADPEPVTFDITVQRNSGHNVVHVSGELDAATAPNLSEVLRCCAARTPGAGKLTWPR